MKANQRFSFIRNGINKQFQMKSKAVLLSLLTAIEAMGIVSAQSSFMEKMGEIINGYYGYVGFRILEGLISLLVICLIIVAVYHLVKRMQKESSSLSP